jgi:hypothetical protein
MRKYIIGYLGKIFCFCHESKLFYQNFDNTINKKNKLDPINFTKNNNSIYNQKSSFNDISNNGENNINKFNDNTKFKTTSKSNINNEFIDYNIKENKKTNSSNNLLNLKKIITENKEYNLKENRIVLEYSNNQEEYQLNKKYDYDLNNAMNSLNDSNIKSLPKTSEKVNKSNSRTEISPFNDRISRNLEKMLIKLQKSFDPFKIQDENLKFEMLKEILECQRLLLQANINDKNQKQITINQIYDEWKILAMIVDRICFFIYLLALIGSSVLFFFKENLIND